jgi:hypothetical protein
MRFLATALAATFFDTTHATEVFLEAGSGEAVSEKSSP